MVVSEVCKVNKAPSPVLTVKSSVKLSEPVSICVTAAPEPAPSAYTMAVLPVVIVTVVPEPCLIMTDWFVPFYTKYNLS